MSDLLSAPAAERNQNAIQSALAKALPKQGQVLEIASGTGQHIAAFARAFPDLQWHPSDVSAERFEAVHGWRAASGAANLSEPVLLDACAAGWARKWAPLDVVLVVNLLHLVSDAQMAVFLDEAHRVLRQGGVLAIYGPFLRDGQTTSPGDQDFHRQLRAQDCAIGYKDLSVVCSVLRALDFSVDVTEMPANNLFVMGQKAMHA